MVERAMTKSTPGIEFLKKVAQESISRLCSGKNSPQRSFPALDAGDKKF
jgi:hypothetical protein